MNIEKLFHVLVLGGAAMGLAACGDAKEGGTGGSGAGSNEGGHGGAGGMNGQGGAAGMGGEGGNAGGGAGGTAGAGGSGLQCSLSANPADPCGCPCCWVDSCLNTEPCCATFCKAGNAGAGCCGG